MECLPGNMISIKEILKKLEEFETNEDKIDYLNEVLDETEDENLAKELNKILDELENNLETKLSSIEIPQARKIIREIDLDEAEQNAEQIQNKIQRQTARPDLTIRQNDNENLDLKYSSNNNYSNAKIYSQGSFDYNSMQKSFETDFMKSNIVRENILNPETALTEIEKENLAKKLRESMPGVSEEQLIMYQARITDELKKDEKSKYIGRLR